MINRLAGILFIALIFLVSPAHSQAEKITDSLTSLLATQIPDTTRMKANLRLAQIYMKQKNISGAEELVKECFTMVSNSSIKAPAELYYTRADIYFAKREIQPALDDMQRVLEILKIDRDVKSIGKANNFIGLILHYGGQFSKSIQTYQENIQYLKQHNMYEMLPVTYYGLSNVYRTTQDYEEQRKNLFLMADAALKVGDDHYAARAYWYLGDIGMEIDSNFSYAIELYKKSLTHYETMQDSSMISFMLLRIGWNHYLNKELDEALDYFFYSLEYSIPINRLTSITNAYGNIGTIYRDKKDYDKAIKFYKKSIEYSYKAKDWYNLSWLHLDMSQMNRDQGNYKLAYENHVLHKKFSDSVEMKKYNEGLADARTRYEAERAEKELELVSLKLDQQKYLTYGFAGLVFLAIIIGLLVFRQTRMSAKRRISEMNHKISEITQKNLRQQMNPHFIFNTLNSIQYYMYQHDKISTNNYLTKFSLLMRKTLENSQHTSIPIKDELDALELYLELEALRFKEKFEYSIRVDDEIDTVILKIPTMLIQPYVENSISHGLVNKEGKGFVNVDLTLDDDRLVCTIEDNGIGRKAAIEIKNQKKGNHNSLGTKITESRLNLVNSLYGKNMKIDYTDLEDEQGVGIGTRVRIYIPIMT